MPDGETVVRSTMMSVQVTEPTAFAHIKTKNPELGDRLTGCELRRKPGSSELLMPENVSPHLFVILILRVLLY